jgi:arsenate reductase (glutaredoxin)
MKVTLYHNPRCSKSREALALLESQQHQVTTKLYMENRLSSDEIKQLLHFLNINASALIRTKETLYQELGLDNEQTTEAQLIAAMSQYPKLMERPIAVCKGKARIGRPPETVLELFNS